MLLLLQHCLLRIGTCCCVCSHVCCAWACVDASSALFAALGRVLLLSQHYYLRSNACCCFFGIVFGTCRCFSAMFSVLGRISLLLQHCLVHLGFGCVLLLVSFCLVRVATCWRSCSIVCRAWVGAAAAIVWADVGCVSCCCSCSIVIFARMRVAAYAVFFSRCYLLVLV
jgi:hypothetical protein